LFNGISVPGWRRNGGGGKAGGAGELLESVGMAVVEMDRRICVSAAVIFGVVEARLCGVLLPVGGFSVGGRNGLSGGDENPAWCGGGVGCVVVVGVVP
jgi:hypothetical protein